jgi:protein-disulfide isomerase
MRVLAVVLLAATLLMAGSTANIKGNTYGNPSAPIVLEVFSDFQCPACKTLHDGIFQQILADYVRPGKVYVIYRYYPLTIHPYGRACAEFACAAARVDKYAQVADLLFARQAIIAQTGQIEEIVNSVLTPVEAQTVRSLVKSPVVKGEIDTDVAEGSLVPVTGTPTLWVTARGKASRAINWPVEYRILRAYFDSLLK